ncbi:MAG TPA: sulfate ABC transporter permease subunit CysW [Planctomycetaceae bacterium]|jgi:sulfate transport system permease protein|nr:sulfate ABC transporter permease subunit CysW [Planctomycetaceae bacterium]
MEAERLETTAVGPSRRFRQDPALVRIALILLGLAIVTVLIVIPVANVFYQALSHGFGTYWRNLVDDPDTRHAILLTLIVAPISVALNVCFGIAAAWAVTRFQFRGRTFLVTVIDLPFAISPVVAGLMFVLLFGLQGYFGLWLRSHDIHIIFALPGLILATTFVTLPFVARELIPVMESLGPDEEMAALSLGAGGWQIFWRVTLPNIKWGLLYGVILCNARAIGEFGAVYVVSGHIAGQTDTMPLRVQKLFDEYNNPGSFAVGSMLTSLALLSLLARVWLERKTHREMVAGARLGSVLLPTKAKQETP